MRALPSHSLTQSVSVKSRRKVQLPQRYLIHGMIMICKCNHYLQGLGIHGENLLALISDSEIFFLTQTFLSSLLFFSSTAGTLSGNSGGDARKILIIRCFEGATDGQLELELEWKYEKWIGLSDEFRLAKGITITHPWKCYHFPPALHDSGWFRWIWLSHLSVLTLCRIHGEKWWLSPHKKIKYTHLNDMQSVGRTFILC